MLKRLYRVWRWLTIAFEDAPKQGTPPLAASEACRESWNSWAWKNIAISLAGDMASVFPGCPRCWTGSYANVAARMKPWAFQGATPQEVREVLNTVVPFCARCQVELDARKIYERVILLMRCWATQGASPREVQEVLDAAANTLGVLAFRWVSA